MSTNLTKTWIIRVTGYKTIQKAQTAIDMLVSKDTIREYHNNEFRIVANLFGTYDIERFE